MLLATITVSQRLKFSKLLFYVADHQLLSTLDTSEPLINIYRLGWDRDMMRPGMLDPYSRAFVGWLTPVEIMTDGYYPIQRTFTVSPNIPGLFRV